MLRVERGVGQVPADGETQDEDDPTARQARWRSAGVGEQRRHGGAPRRRVPRRTGSSSRSATGGGTRAGSCGCRRGPGTRTGTTTCRPRRSPPGGTEMWTGVKPPAGATPRRHRAGVSDGAPRAAPSCRARAARPGKASCVDGRARRRCRRRTVRRSHRVSVRGKAFHWRYRFVLLSSLRRVMAHRVAVSVLVVQPVCDVRERERAETAGPEGVSPCVTRSEHMTFHCLCGYF